MGKVWSLGKVPLGKPTCSGKYAWAFAYGHLRTGICVQACYAGGNHSKLFVEGEN
jgi:hypothetical protein